MLRGVPGDPIWARLLACAVVMPGRLVPGVRPGRLFSPAERFREEALGGALLQERVTIYSQHALAEVAHPAPGFLLKSSGEAGLLDALHLSLEAKGAKTGCCTAFSCHLKEGVLGSRLLGEALVPRDVPRTARSEQVALPGAQVERLLHLSAVQKDP